MSTAQPQSRILNLPYDIRYTIYTHLFPPGQQIYLQALSTRLQAIAPPEGIPIHILLVCKQLHAEAGGYLYNNYLFNIVGTKTLCLARYRDFQVVMERYARDEVRIDAFSNGEHSATMCLSLQAGEAKVPVLVARGRGERREIEELERENAAKTSVALRDCFTIGLVFCSLIVALVAWLVAR